MADKKFKPNGRELIHVQKGKNELVEQDGHFFSETENGQRGLDHIYLGDKFPGGNYASFDGADTRHFGVGIELRTPEYLLAERNRKEANALKRLEMEKVAKDIFRAVDRENSKGLSFG